MVRRLIYVVLLGFASQNVSGDTPDDVIAEMICAIRNVSYNHAVRISHVRRSLELASEHLAAADDNRTQLRCLVKIEVLRRELLRLESNELSEINKIKYLKGLQIIRILYEKILSLDHHFASVRSINEINKLSNPNQYPEFSKFKDILAGRKSDNAILLNGILGSNSIVSIIHAFSGVFTSSMSRKQQEAELAKIECIIDFSLRMQADLNTIFFDTAFLHKSNESIKSDLETLFRDYTRPIGYLANLESCRAGDDWESVRQKTDEYLAALSLAEPAKKQRMQVNMEFPVDRLLLFITQYNTFIDQGGKFYEKFRIILNSYENEKQCEAKLPSEYKKLRSDIDLAIEKFNVSYKPVEINGSKMKEILYGINEFE